MADIPTSCPVRDCGSTELLWSFSKRLSPHGPMDGRLRMHDVIPRIYLACEVCGEVLKTVEDDDELTELIQTSGA